jgi:hypothetical protein
MHKRPQFLAQSKTDRMSNNASCKRWDTPKKRCATQAYGLCARSKRMP